MKKKRIFILVVLSALVLSFAMMSLGMAKIDSAQAITDASIKTSVVKSFYLVEYDTGTVLSAYNENERRPIASMVKIMTLLLTFDAVDQNVLQFDQKLTISEFASSMGGSQMFLDAHSEYTVSDLIKGVTVCSANDAAVALGEAISGSIESFVDRMNARASELGMKDTLFCNTTGLPGGEQYSTAKDVSIMMRTLLKHKEYYKYSKIWIEDYKHADGRITQMVNTNKLIRYYNGCDAGKTGFTNDAMFCLSASAERKDMRVVATVLGGSDSKTRFKAASELFNYAFANYEEKVLIRKGEPIANNIEIAKAKDSDIEVYCDKDLKIFSKKKGTPDYSVRCVYDESVKAPLAANSSIGRIEVVGNNGQVIDSANIRVRNEVMKENYLDLIRKVLRNWFLKK